MQKASRRHLQRLNLHSNTGTLTLFYICTITALYSNLMTSAAIHTLPVVVT